MNDVVEFKLNREDLLKALQFFHAKLNNDIFNNKLKPVCIKYEYMYDNALARFCYLECMFKVSSIHFNIENIIDDIIENDEIDIELFYSYITILLHEMIHQYCCENSLEDVDENDKHTKVFVMYADKFGLDCNGYRIKEELKENIKNDIYLYFANNQHYNLIDFV